MPIYAECGGMMYLGSYIETLEGVRYPMAEVLPFGTRMLGRRKALGYTEVELLRPCLLGPAGLRLRGHEFHYSEIVPPSEEALASRQGETALEEVYLLRRKKADSIRREGYRTGSVLASYIHLHWGSAPEAAFSFVQHCREFHQ